MASKLTSKYVTSSDGSKVYADALGNPNNPALILIHGVCLSCVVFDNILFETDFSNDFYLVRSSKLTESTVLTLPGAI